MLIRVMLLHEEAPLFLVFPLFFSVLPPSLYSHPLFPLIHPPPISLTPCFLSPSVSPYIVPSRGMFVRVAFFCGRALPISTPRDCAAIGVTPHGTYIHVAHAALRTFIARRRCCRRLLHTMNSLFLSLSQTRPKAAAEHKLFTERRERERVNPLLATEKEGMVLYAKISRR